jgi:hypothetical protein
MDSHGLHLRGTALVAMEMNTSFGVQIGHLNKGRNRWGSMDHIFGLDLQYIDGKQVPQKPDPLGFSAHLSMGLVCQ